MDDDDIVLPSDPEELEELRAEEDLEGYWKAAAPVLARNLAIVRARQAPERGAGTFSRSATETRQTRSDDEGGSGRPRKRAKVRRTHRCRMRPSCVYMHKLQHSLSDENVGQARPQSASNTLASRRVAGDISNSPVLVDVSIPA